MEEGVTAHAVVIKKNFHNKKQKSVCATKTLSIVFQKKNNKDQKDKQINKESPNTLKAEKPLTKKTPVVHPVFQKTTFFCLLLFEKQKGNSRIIRTYHLAYISKFDCMTELQNTRQKGGTRKKQKTKQVKGEEDIFHQNKRPRPPSPIKQKRAIEKGSTDTSLYHPFCCHICHIIAAFSDLAIGKIRHPALTGFWGGAFMLC